MANVVLVHGLWADGSSWSGVIPPLQQAGHRVTAVQLALNSLDDDVEVARGVVAAQDGPTVLAGHSYGGVVISGAAVDQPHVVGLVYVSAFAPDAHEEIGPLIGRYPAAPAFATIRPDARGYLWLDPETFPEVFAGDVDPVQARVMAAVQRPAGPATQSGTLRAVAWRDLPSRYLLSERDQVIDPGLQRFMAERIGAEITAVPSGHASLVSHADAVVDLIGKAAA